MTDATIDIDAKVEPINHTHSTTNDQRSSSPIPPPYSAFTKTQKWLIISLSSFAASFSPLSSFIFFPAIPALSSSLHVSTGKINLTITSYMIVAGIAPTLLGDLADAAGRRLVYLLMISIYCLANVGLALQRSWAALFVLRMLQSAGSASTIAVGYGVVSDIATPVERSHFVSGMVLGPNIATAVGPILGGALTNSLGPSWIFWLLTILSGTCVVLIALLLPETARLVVGNGSDEVSAYRRPILSRFFSISPSSCQSSYRGAAEKTTHQRSPVDRKKFHVPNLMASLKLLGVKDCLLIVLIFGIFYMNLSCVQASTSTLFISAYRISEFEAGLVYLPAGIGSIIGAYGAGKYSDLLILKIIAHVVIQRYILNYDYRITARKHGIVVDKQSGDDLAIFPIEEARLRSIELAIGATGLSTIGYGWSLKYQAHMAVPLTLQFIVGFSTAIVFNTTGTLLTDVHPNSPSRASAANSIVRCLLAGGGLALVQIFFNWIGVQWTFTLLGLICMACLCLVFLERKHGKYWRDEICKKGIKR